MARKSTTAAYRCRGRSKLIPSYHCDSFYRYVESEPVVGCRAEPGQFHRRVLLSLHLHPIIRSGLHFVYDWLFGRDNNPRDLKGSSHTRACCSNEGRITFYFAKCWRNAAPVMCTEMSNRPAANCTFPNCSPRDAGRRAVNHSNLMSGGLPFARVAKYSLSSSLLKEGGKYGLYPLAAAVEYGRPILTHDRGNILKLVKVVLM